jgi:hypothetical protein
MILSSYEDPHAHAVIEGLRARGVGIELLDLSDFPTRLALSMAFGKGERRFALRRKGGGCLDLATIGSVWWRRPQPFRLPQTLRDPAHRRFVISESSTALFGLYQALDCFWVNDPARDEAAHHKPWQLALAQQIGMAIPVTLMTNDPEEAKRFWQQHEGKVIYKLFRALPDAWRETRRLAQTDIPLAESIRLAPVIFQEWVEAVAEIRVTVIGEEMFAAEADARSGEYPVDFRFNGDLRWQQHCLPAPVQAHIREMMRRLGLEYGAIDLRLTPEGEYVFLEINPAGQFLWIELATGMKIADALAARLAWGRGRAQERGEAWGVYSPPSAGESHPHLIAR